VSLQIWSNYTVCTIIYTHGCDNMSLNSSIQCLHIATNVLLA